MKKQMIKRGFMGFSQGIAIGYVITIIISVILAKGHYVAVTPELVAKMGSEINAVILQTILCGIMGSGFAMASIIWEMDSWSLLKQTGIYFGLACVLMLPIAYFANWMQHSVTGVLVYIGLFVAFFIIAWLIQYFVWKSKIDKMNHMVKENKKNQ